MQKINKLIQVFAMCGLLCTISFGVIAQKTLVQPSSKLLTTFRFVLLTGGIILLKGTIDNKEDSLTFILDTGCGGISLDSATVERLGFLREKSNKTIKGIAGTRKIDFTNNHRLNLPTLTVDSLNFHINDYDLLTSVYGIKIDGVIGYSFLKRYIVRIDYDKLLIEVYSNGTFKYPSGGYLIRPNLSPLPTNDLKLNDSHTILSNFIFDTGAGLNMLLSDDFVKDSSVFKKKRKFFRTQGEGIGGKKLMNLSIIKLVHLGPYRFRKVPVYIFEDSYNVTSYPSYSGVIGNDLLRRFNLIINYHEGTIQLKPNKHYLDSFNYSYSGLGIYEFDGNVRIMDIIPNSPGDKAGFKSGDIILSVDNQVFKEIQTIRLALQNAGNTVKVTIMREKQLLQLELKIINILNR